MAPNGPSRIWRTPFEGQTKGEQSVFWASLSGKVSGKWSKFLTQLLCFMVAFTSTELKSQRFCVKSCFTFKLCSIDDKKGQIAMRYWTEEPI
jgi:hypothetical protein